MQLDVASIGRAQGLSSGTPTAARCNSGPKTISHAIDSLSTILGAAVRDEDLELKANPADERRLRVKIPKKAARDFLEADEVLSLLVAGEIVDNPVRPETAAAAAEVRRSRDVEHLTRPIAGRRMQWRSSLACDLTAATPVWR